MRYTKEETEQRIKAHVAALIAGQKSNQAIGLSQGVGGDIYSTLYPNYNNVNEENPFVKAEHVKSLVDALKSYPSDFRRSTILDHVFKHSLTPQDELLKSIKDRSLASYNAWTNNQAIRPEIMSEILDDLKTDESQRQSGKGGDSLTLHALANNTNLHQPGVVDKLLAHEAAPELASKILSNDIRTKDNFGGEVALNKDHLSRIIAQNTNAYRAFPDDTLESKVINHPSFEKGHIRQFEPSLYGLGALTDKVKTPTGVADGGSPWLEKDDVKYLTERMLDHKFRPREGEEPSSADWGLNKLILHRNFDKDLGNHVLDRMMQFHSPEETKKRQIAANAPEKKMRYFDSVPVEENGYHPWGDFHNHPLRSLLNSSGLKLDADRFLEHLEQHPDTLHNIAPLFSYLLYKNFSKPQMRRAFDLASKLKDVDEPIGLGSAKADNNYRAVAIRNLLISDSGTTPAFSKEHLLKAMDMKGVMGQILEHPEFTNNPELVKKAMERPLDLNLVRKIFTPELGSVPIDDALKYVTDAKPELLRSDAHMVADKIYGSGGWTRKSELTDDHLNSLLKHPILGPHFVTKLFKEKPHLITDNMLTSKAVINNPDNYSEILQNIRQNRPQLAAHLIREGLKSSVASNRETAKENYFDAPNAFAPDDMFPSHVDVKFDTNKLRQVRDLINEKFNGKTTKKALGNAFTPLLNPVVTGKGEIDAANIDKMISGAQTHRYNISHTLWRGGQRHNGKPSKVFQLNVTNDHLQKLKEAGLLDEYQMIQREVNHGGHPTLPHTLGWARWTGHPKSGIHIDELQSDLWKPLARARAERETEYSRPTPQVIPNDAPVDPLTDETNLRPATRMETQEEAHRRVFNEHLKHFDQRFPLDKHKKIMDILFNGRHPGEVIHEALLQYHRDRGNTGIPIAIHSPKLKMPLSGQQDNRPPPVHMKESYQDIPKKLGYQPAQYGDVPRTQTNPDILIAGTGKPSPPWGLNFKTKDTFQDKIRKRLKEVNAVDLIKKHNFTSYERLLKIDFPYHRFAAMLAQNGWKKQSGGGDHEHWAHQGIPRPLAVKRSHVNRSIDKQFMLSRYAPQAGLKMDKDNQLVPDPSGDYAEAYRQSGHLADNRPKVRTWNPKDVSGEIKHVPVDSIMDLEEPDWTVGKHIKTLHDSAKDTLDFATAPTLALPAVILAKPEIIDGKPVHDIKYGDNYVKAAKAAGYTHVPAVIPD